MSYIIRDGKIYEQVVHEVEVDIEAEKYRLQAWKDAILIDERDRIEYMGKLDEIDGLNLSNEYKEKLKASIQLDSGSGITQLMVDEQEVRVSSLLNP